VATGIAACASGGSASTSAQPTGSKQAQGSPLTIMDISTLTSPGQSLNVYPEAPAAVNAAANAINARGGVDGHPIKVVVCDDQASPNQAAVCGRQAISDQAVAVTSQSLFSSSYINELAAARIPLVGNSVIGAADFTSLYSFPIGSSVLSEYPAGALGLIKAGKAQIGIARIDTPLDIVTINAVSAAIRSAGGKLTTTVAVPTTVSDYGSYAQTLKQSGANGVVLIESQAAAVGIIQASEEINYHPTWAIILGTLTATQIVQLKSFIEGAVVSSTLPLTSDTSLLGIRTFDSDMKAEQGRGDSAADLLDQTSLGAWLAVYAIADTLKGTTAPITSTVLLSKLRALHSLDLFDLITWQPNVAGPSDEPRVSSGLSFISVIRNGAVVSTGETVNLYKP
jgi:ABC-type branched-subunit amino acid transport system substrate-binding protein